MVGKKKWCQQIQNYRHLFCLYRNDKAREITASSAIQRQETCVIGQAHGTCTVETLERRRDGELDVPSTNVHTHTKQMRPQERIHLEEIIIVLQRKCFSFILSGRTRRKSNCGHLHICQPTSEFDLREGDVRYPVGRVGNPVVDTRLTWFSARVSGRYDANQLPASVFLQHQRSSGIALF